MYFSFRKRFSWLNDVKEAQCLAQRQEKREVLLLRAVGNAEVCFELLTIIF